jgi:hypothetical protein
VSLVLANRAATGDDARPDWDEMLRRLNAPEFPVRREAEELLVADPSAESAQRLVESTRDASDEVRIRCVRILTRWFLSSDLKIADSAEESLVELAQDENTRVAGAAAFELLSNRELRQARAIEALRKLGAKVDIGPDLAALAVEFNVANSYPDWMMEGIAYVSAEVNPQEHLDIFIDPADAPPPVPDENIPKAVVNVFLTQGWQGGTDGLHHLRRLEHSTRTITVYVGVGQDEFRLEVMRAVADIPVATVEERGPSLGVRGTPLSSVCYIDRVIPGGAADRAGLQPGDMVESFNGEPISDFSDLINAVGERQVGDDVEIVVYRDREEVTLTAKLVDWTEIDTETGLWTEPIPEDVWRQQFFMPGIK